jgi:alkylation response protein AidB-like acyl-CoA dehydrogenase
MDVRLSAEQVALRDAAARLIEQFGPRTVVALDDRGRADKLDAAITAAGWREVRGPTDDGAPLASAVEAALVAEELARGLADTAFIGPTLAADLRRRAGVPAAAGLETVVAESFAVDARGCNAALVVLGDGELCRVELNKTHRAADLTRDVAPLSNAPVERIGHVAADDLARWEALGIALTCADLVGVMRGATALATEYAGDRRQFGAPVGSFQAVQHMLADALVATEGSSSAALHAAWSVDAHAAEEAELAGAVAKAYCSRAAVAVCETAIQVHGGIGNTWDCLAHVYLRRALFAIDLFGDAGRSLERVLAHNGIGASDGLR